MHCRDPRTILSVVIAALSLAIAAGAINGCGGNSSPLIIVIPPTATPTKGPTGTPTSTATPTATPTPSPAPTAPASVSGSSAFAVDLSRQLGYVPLFDSDDPGTGRSRVAIMNLAADPNLADPRVGTVVFTHSDVLTSATIDTGDSLVIVTSGGIGNGGRVDLIDETSNTIVAGSPFTLPAGADVVDLSGLSVGQALYDPVRKLVIISTVDDQIQGNCPSPGQCTGFLTFNPLTHKFSPVIPASASSSFALNAQSDFVFNASLFDPQGSATVVDMAKSKVCVLKDSNLDANKGGVSLDPMNQIAVVGNFSGETTLVNLFGSSFNETVSPCTFNEGGTPPNSLSANAATLLTGVAFNPVTHQAFLIENTGNTIFLVPLPSSPVPQLMQSDVGTLVLSFIPDNPFGFTWQTEGLPNGVAVDFTRNVAYALDNFSNFLVQIDLAKFQAAPSNLVTPLPAGTCKDLGSSAGCNNGFGVVYFPLPPAFGQ